MKNSLFKYDDKIKVIHVIMCVIGYLKNGKWNFRRRGGAA